MSNKSNGTAFERKFAQLLAEHGFWAHVLNDNRNGQPFDIIAAKHGETFVFDCKDCKSEKFLFSRIEPNQEAAMELWQGCGNHEGLFAIQFPFLGIRLLPYTVAAEMRQEGYAGISGKMIIESTVSVKEWLEVV